MEELRPDKEGPSGRRPPYPQWTGEWRMRGAGAGNGKHSPTSVEEEQIGSKVVNWGDGGGAMSLCQVSKGRKRVNMDLRVSGSNSQKGGKNSQKQATLRKIQPLTGIH